MSKQDNSAKEPMVNDYREDLVGILRAIFKRKLLVVSGIVFFILLSLVLSLILPKVYRSEGFFQLSEPSREQSNVLFSTASGLLESSRLLVFSQLKDLGMLNVLRDLKIEPEEPENFFTVTLQDFKKYSSGFNDFQGYLRFVKNNKYLDQEQFEYLKNHIKDSSQFSKLSKETYALSRDDLKYMAKALTEEKNYVVGVELEMEANQKKTAQKFLSVFGEFIRFCIFYEKLNEYVTSHLNEFKALANRYENYILRNNALLQQLLKKKEKFQLLYKKYPAFAKIESRQVVSLEDQGERYLSLVAQIIGVESRIVDLEQLLESFKLEKEKSELYLAFFTQLKQKVLDKKLSSGEEVFKAIEAVKEGSFKDKDPGDPEVQAVRNSLTIDIERFHVLFYKTLRYISGPSLPETPEWPRKSIFLILGFFIGTLLSIFAAMLLEFWSKNKKFIKSNK